MANPLNSVQPRALIDPASFDAPDEPRSNTKTLDHRPYLSLELSQLMSGFGAHSQSTRLSALFDPHLYIDFSLMTLPTDFSFNLLGQAETNLDGSTQRAGGGVEVLFGLAPLAHVYLRNSLVKTRGEEGLGWLSEGGLRFPTVFYEGASHLGGDIGYGGYLLNGSEANHFTASLIWSF